MSNLNIDILNQNIQTLMEQEGLTQQQLAEKIDMSQPNFSRAFNNKGGQRFTLEQICKIADHFQVSIDFLLGFEKPTNKLSEKEICTLFTSLLEQRKLVKFDISREEEIYTPYKTFDGYPDCDTEKKHIQYNGFLFPSYFDIGPTDRYTEDQLDDFQSDILYGGNSDESNKRINAFFDRYFQIYDMYLHNQITKEFFHEIVDKFLADLS